MAKNEVDLWRFSSQLIVVIVGALCLSPSVCSGDEAGLRTRTDFTCGGSITAVVSDAANQEITASKPGGWWAFRVQGCDSSRPLRIVMQTRKPEQQHPFVYLQADGGFELVSDGETVDKGGTTVRYTAENPARSCLVARYAPYALADATKRLEQTRAAVTGSELFDLGPTREGRSVPGLRIKYPGVPESERFGVWIQARQHAWEVTGSWVADGFLSWLASADPRALELLGCADIVVIPVFEPDGVERGIGWMSNPNTNRQWLLESPSVYPQVERAQAMLRSFDARSRGLQVFFDLHCYTVTSGDSQHDWDYWATWFKGEQPNAQANEILKVAQEAVSSVPSSPFVSGIRDKYNPSYPGAGTRLAPQMAELWVRSQFPDAWTTTVEHSIFSRKRIDAGEKCPVPEDHRQRGPVIGRVILQYLRAAASATTD